MDNKFQIKKIDGKARLGVYKTAHGEFNTPAFMPVGTQGTVKGVTPENLKSIGAEIILSNTYHLHIRPGEKLVKELGGIHKFMAWNGPILTDSGGFQIFSLKKLRKLTEDAAYFNSHLDGKKIRLSPEDVVRIQQDLGVDIAMVLDECTPYPSDEKSARESLELTLKWAERSKKAKEKEDMSLFGIVQGGMHPELRKYSANRLVEIGFDAYAIGGLSVGEPVSLMQEICEVSCNSLPEDRLRYMMGVGTPSDIVSAVSMGVDLFDCVMPTRSARFGRIFTMNGFFNIKNKEFREDKLPLEEDCLCYTCKNFSRAYLSHLYHSKEALYVVLSSIHNLAMYQALMKRIREEIKNSTFSSYSSKFLANSKYL